MKLLPLALTLLAGVPFVACGSIASLQDRPCPCDTGFACVDHICVAQAAGSIGGDSVDNGSDAGKGNSGFTNTDAGSGGNTFVDPTECAVDCEGAAINGCNLDGFTADSQCVALCGTSPTASQLSCLQAASCSTLLNALAGSGAVCGITVPNADAGPLGNIGGDDGSAADTGNDASAPVSSFCTFFTDGDQGLLNYCTGAASSGPDAAQLVAQSELNCASMGMGGTLVAACPSANLEGCCTTSVAPPLVNLYCYYGAEANEETSCIAGGGTWATTLPSL
jgi:hypothetical protein